MGPDLATAAAIRECCRERGLTAAVNFQLRFSPNVLAVRDLIARNELGPSSTWTSASSSINRGISGRS
jgi:predicted dehydrogenase